MDLENLLDRARTTSAFGLSLPLAGVLTLANLLALLAPNSAVLALLATLIWFAAALAVFVLVTWLRQDHWLTAGFILGLTPVVARTVSDAIAHLGTLPSFDNSTALLVRAIIAVPLCGGVVFGARWLTNLIRGADTSPAKRRRA